MSPEVFEQKSKEVTYRFIQMTGKKPNLNTMLFLIGIQELGKGPRKYSKEEKQDLMNLGTCAILSLSGYFGFIGYDEDGWPHWEIHKAVPKMSLEEQERFLMEHIILYFEDLNKAREDNNV